MTCWKCGKPTEGTRFCPDPMCSECLSLKRTEKPDMRSFGIYTKIGARGGSEQRAAEICNTFTRDFKTHLFCEAKLNPDIRAELLPEVEIHEDTPESNEHIKKLENLDVLLVVNSDSYSFSKLDYWLGKTKKKNGNPHHNGCMDLSKIGRIGFLYNFVISPATKLWTIYETNPNLVIISTNKFFVDEIERKDGKKNRDEKFKKIHECGIPRYTVNSPISIKKFDVEKTPSDIVRIGRHSLPYDSKFHPNNVVLMKEILKRYRGKVVFDHMGVPSEYYKELKDDDIRIREKYSIPVPEYLKGIDIFVYYTKWSRREPWPRVTAEAMMGGCCVISNGIFGMKEQIENGVDGFLAHDDADFFTILSYLIEHPEVVKEVSGKAKEKAKNEFSSEAVYQKMKDILMS